jgi:Cd2+/Zn2+-exporting ATPase/Cu+-exporting ATPase
MDKTGTLTIGRPEVTDVIALGTEEAEVLRLAAVLERRSEHPLAEGIVRSAEAHGLSPGEPRDFTVYPGEGVTGIVDGVPIVCGTERLLARAGVAVPDETRARVAKLADDGKSVVLVARDGRGAGLVALADTLRPEVPAALAALRELGIRHFRLLTGDRRQVAQAMASRLGLEFDAEVLPEQKIAVIRRLQAEGRVVAMLGDGINDAPALAQADVGIAMGVAGTDAALEAAHVALMGDDWRAVPDAVRTGRRAFRTIQQNLWFTAGYNVVGLALAALGWLTPIVAAAAQSLPDVAVMLNSARLLRRGSDRPTSLSVNAAHDRPAGRGTTSSR